MITLDNVTNYKLILTKECNMNCVYCIQNGKNRTIHDDPNKNPLSPQKLANLFPNDKPYHITFFGGEPLLNFDYMIEFVEALNKFNKQVEYSVVTNGSLMTLDKVKKINDLNIRVTISHDGVCYKETRSSKDILEDKGNIISKIRKLGFIVCMTSKNWNFYDNWDYFERFRLKYYIQRPTVCFIAARDLIGNIDDSLFIYKNKEFETMLKSVFSKLKYDIVSHNYESYEYKAFRRVLEKMYYEGILNHGITTCLSMGEALNIDICGNIYVCHNRLDIIAGNISDLYNVEKQKFQIADRCINCPTKQFCPKCPRVLENKRKYYCYFQKCILGGLINMLLELQKENVML